MDAEKGEVDKKDIIVYKKIKHRCRNIFHIASEPVWYSTILSLHYFCVLTILYISVDGKCKTNKWVVSCGIPEILYFVDILTLIDIALSLGGKYIPHLEMPDINLNSRPLWIMIIEIVSLIPVELALPYSNLAEQKVHCLGKMTTILRYVRIIYFFHQARNLIYSSICMRILEMFSHFAFLIFLANNIFCNENCFAYGCKETICKSYESVFEITTEMTGSGHKIQIYTLCWNLTATLMKLVIFFMVTNLTLAFVTVELINIYTRQVIFVNKFYMIIRKQEQLGNPKFVIQETVKYCNNIWHTRGGHSHKNEFLQLLPASMQNELMIDISWLAYKHSNLFKDMSLPFLRELAMYMKQEYKMPGELIWARNQLKTQMIYVISGTIQLLSEEDGDSPILSLTSGTCLGESTLLISYKARNSVRCKEFCELYSLRREDLLFVSRKYPKEISLLNKMIVSRYNHAKRLKALSDISKSNIRESKRELDTYTIVWMKNTLHKLMSKDQESTRRHEFQNIYLLSEATESHFNKMLFSANFLNSMVIAERIELNMDTVFVKPTCPCVLQPNSLIVYVWEVVILFATLFLSFIIPLSAFILETPPGWYNLVVLLGTLLFWFDIYVEISISVVARDITTTNFRTTVTSRMQTVEFWLDCFSCVPCEILRSVILETITSGSYSKMHINRLAKLWRVERLFRRWEKSFNANFVLLRFAKFIWINLYTIFIFWCLIHSNKRAPHLFMAVQIATETAIIDLQIKNKLDHILTFLTSVTAWMITLLMRANILSAYVLINLFKFEIQQFSEDVFNTLKSKTLNATYLDRIHTYLATQWMDNRCTRLKYSRSRITELPSTIFYNIFLYGSKDILLKTPFFELLPVNCVYDIAGKCIRSFIYSPNEVILYAGDMSNNITIIYEGTCEIRNSKNKSLAFSDSYATINLLETILRVPAVNTYIATTYCKAFYMDIKELESVLINHGSVWNNYNDTREQSTDIKQQCTEMSHFEEVVYRSTAVHVQSNKSVYNFGYNLRPNSFKEADYYIPFDKLYPFSFIRHFLLRRVILPDGKLITIWESFRIFFAVSSCLLYFTIPIVVNRRYTILLLFLDLTALADLYVRLHVAFYNADGILIKHPLYTAKHYISHGFLTDFIAIFPLGYFATTDNLWYYVLNINRMLQLHRYHNFFDHFDNLMLTPTSKLHVLIYVPILLIIYNFFGNWLVTMECMYMPNSKNYNSFIGLKCTNNSIIVNSPFPRPVSKIRAHLFGVFLATNILTNTTVEGVALLNKVSYLFIAIMSLIGYYLKAVILGKIFALYTTRQCTLLNYQEAMHSLQSYLKTVCVNPKLTNIIMDYYEFKWNYTKGKNIHNALVPFQGALPIDILYEIYGKILYNSSIFTDKVPSFYRNLVKSMKHEIIKKGGYLVTINDITEDVHILYAGSADVISPDGTVLDTISIGSICGNLEDTKMSRSRVSIIASSHVEILSIPAVEFHNILKYYPKIQKQYHLLKAKYIRYIRSDKYGIVMPEKIVGSKHFAKVRTFALHKYFNPSSKLMGFWTILNLMYTCYLGIILDLYQFGSLDYSIPILCMQYSSDVLYILQYLIKERTAYENESGTLVTDLALIKKHNRKNKLLFTITIISLIPLDIFILTCMPETVTKYHLFSLIRCNRILRLTYIFNYFRNLSTQLNIVLYVTRFLYILMWTSLYFCGFASTIAFTACYYPSSIIGTSDTCEAIFKTTSLSKFEIYTKYFHLTFNCFTFSPVNKLYPQATIMLIIRIAGTILSLILNSVCISQIFSVVSQCNYTKFLFRNIGNQLKSFMAREDVSISLTERVINFVQLLWLRKRGVIHPQLLKDAPLYLQDAILYDAFAHLILDHPIFRKCHTDCLRQIIQKMRTETYFTDDYIQFKDTIDETMYFVFEGEVKVIDENQFTQDNTIKIIRKGGSFGVLQGIYERCPHIYTYQAHKLSRSNSREVTLTGVDRKTSGEFKCEVSADAPLFHTEIRAAHLLVADIPDEGPVLRTDVLKVAPGATIKANCTTPGSYPPMNVTWFVNDVEVVPRNATEILKIIETYEALPGLETVRSIFTMHVHQTMFKNSKIKLRCLATMFTLYRRTKEIELQEDAPLLALVMEPTPHSNKGINNVACPTYHNFIFMTIAVTCVVLHNQRFNFH